MVEQSIAGSYIVQDAKIAYVNPRFAEIFGYDSADEMIGMDALSLVHEKDRGMAANELRQRQEGEVLSNSVEFTGLRKDGSMIEVGLHGTRGIHDGRPATIGLLQDVTERKRAEEALRKSESEFRTLAEAMPQIVWITRPDGWNIYFNQRWMDYTGMTLDESLGHGWNKPFHPDDQKRAWAAWQQATKGRSIYSLEARLRRADGVYRWWLVRGAPLHDATGNIVKWFGTCTDIHDLKAAELEVSSINRALRESERRFSDMLGNVELVSLMRDHEGRITYCNEYLLRLTGWRFEEVIGRDWIEVFIPPAIADKKRDVYAALLANRPEARHHESEILTRSGEHRLIRWSNSVLRAAAGDVIGTASIGEDITEQKRAEKALLQEHASLLQTQQELLNAQESLAEADRLDAWPPVSPMKSRIR